MTIICKMLSGDKPGVFKLLEEFQQESVKEYGFKISREQFELIISEYIDHTLIAVKDGEVVGVIAGSIGTYPLDGSKIYQEVVWYVSKQHRSCGVRLLKALEDYCKEWGVKHIVMVHLGNSKADKLDEFYGRTGYKKMEVHYIKNLG
jgi:GNAT superfamily N-acetyltransferase